MLLCLSRVVADVVVTELFCTAPRGLQNTYIHIDDITKTVTTKSLQITTKHRSGIRNTVAMIVLTCDTLSGY